MQQRIEHRAIRVTGARMHNQVARLVDDQNVAIFVDDIQRDVLRFPTGLFFYLCINGDRLSPQHLLFRFVYRFAIDLHPIVQDPIFYARS
ncbi:hypothetical protein D3C72_1914260 [compost metagenome]